MKLIRLLTARAGLLLAALAPGCAETASSTPQTVTIIKPKQEATEVGGIPPDKMAEIQLVFQNHDSTARKCYNDVLSERHTRAFKGTVRLVVRLEPAGTASSIRVTGGTLSNEKEVTDCLIEKIKDWEFPALTHAADYQTEYKFEPAY